MKIINKTWSWLPGHEILTVEAEIYEEADLDILGHVVEYCVEIGDVKEVRVKKQTGRDALFIGDEVRLAWLIEQDQNKFNDCICG